MVLPPRIASAHCLTIARSVMSVRRKRRSSAGRLLANSIILSTSFGSIRRSEAVRASRSFIWIGYERLDLICSAIGKKLLRGLVCARDAEPPRPIALAILDQWLLSGKRLGRTKIGLPYIDNGCQSWGSARLFELGSFSRQRLRAAWRMRFGRSRENDRKESGRRVSLSLSGRRQGHAAGIRGPSTPRTPVGMTQKTVRRDSRVARGAGLYAEVI